MAENNTLPPLPSRRHPRQESILTGVRKFARRRITAARQDIGAYLKPTASAFSMRTLTLSCPCAGIVSC